MISAGCSNPAEAGRAEGRGWRIDSGNWKNREKATTEATESTEKRKQGENAESFLLKKEEKAQGKKFQPRIDTDKEKFFTTKNTKKKKEPVKQKNINHGNTEARNNIFAMSARRRDRRDRKTRRAQRIKEGLSTETLKHRRIFFTTKNTKKRGAFG